MDALNWFAVILGPKSLKKKKKKVSYSITKAPFSVMFHWFVFITIGFLFKSCSKGFFKYNIKTNQIHCTPKLNKIQNSENKHTQSFCSVRSLSVHGKADWVWDGL